MGVLKTPLNVSTWAKRIHGRPLYLWGAGQSGMGMLKALRRNGVEATGFIDKRTALHGTRVEGLPVHSPDLLRNLDPHIPSPFIVNTTFQYEDAIFASCEHAGLSHHDDFISSSDLQPLHYQISVAGLCNLHCISCPLGNMDKYPAEFMSAETYGKVLDKVLKESPMVGLIQLYNWGEPMLNRELPRIIQMTHDRNVVCAISSNLNIKHDFEDVIAAKPDSFRISISGNRESYASTHNGGNWSRLMANMEKLQQLQLKHSPEMQVEVTYHLYNDTTEAGYRYISDLCEELGFVFRSHMAGLLPLDNVEHYRDQEPMSKEARETLGKLMLPIDEALSIAQSQSDTECTVENTVLIDANLRVKHCGLYYTLDDNTVSDNYLELPIADFVARRNDSALCTRCKSGGLHRYCRVYTDEKIPPFAPAPEATTTGQTRPHSLPVINGEVSHA